MRRSTYVLRDRRAAQGDHQRGSGILALTGPAEGDIPVTERPGIPPVDLPRQGQWRQPVEAGEWLAVPARQRLDDVVQVGTSGDGKADMTRRMPVLAAGQVTEIRPQNLGHRDQELFVVHAESQALTADSRVQQGSVVLSGQPSRHVTCSS